MHKKVLIITTHFPPDRHIGAKRPAKFAKFLPEFGWQPVILTMETKHYHGIDNSLMEDLPDGISIFRPINWSMAGRKKSENTKPECTTSNLSPNKLRQFVEKVVERLSFFNFLWLLSAFYSGIRIVNKQKIDLLFSTSPNPEAHLIGLWLKIVTRRPWVVDFRDPWTADLACNSPNRLMLVIHKLCEKLVVRRADYITATSRALIENLEKIGNYRKKGKTSVIYNGYDECDFGGSDIDTSGTKLFTITYLGTWGTGRNPEPFLKAVQTLLVENPELNGRIRINFIGECKSDQNMQTRIERIISEGNLGCVVKMVPFLPYQKALNFLKHSDVSLLIQSRLHSKIGCLSSKLFEYLYAGKPILALVSQESEEAQIIRAANAGHIVEPDDVTMMTKKIMDMYVDYLTGKKVNNSNMFVVKRYERRKQTENLVSIFNHLVAMPSISEEKSII